MATLFPQTNPEGSPATSPPDDLLERARQTVQQELLSVRQKPQQPNKDTLLTGQRRF